LPLIFPDTQREHKQLEEASDWLLALVYVPAKQIRLYQAEPDTIAPLEGPQCPKMVVSLVEPN